MLNERPQVSSTWLMRNQEVEVHSVSDTHVICRPSAGFSETDIPLIFLFPEFAGEAIKLQETKA